MFKLEKQSDLWENQQKICSYFNSDICIGIDEAGRGALAGPVVAAAVCFDTIPNTLKVNDSKKLSPKKREILYDSIVLSSACWGIGICSCQEIDRINVLQATKLAMSRALDQCIVSMSSNDKDALPSLVVIDGNISISVPSPLKSVAIVKGDTLIGAVAAASILAKVARDRLMKKLDLQFPVYGFSQHKGYGTCQHRRSLVQFGASSQHRLSFNLGIKKKYDYS